MATTNWRTINIDLLDPESPANFSTSSLVPTVLPLSASEVQTQTGQIRQLLRGGDAEGALGGALKSVPYGGDVGAKVSLQRRSDEADYHAVINFPNLAELIKGGTSSHSGRNITIDKTVRYVTDAQSNIQL